METNSTHTEDSIDRVLAQGKARVASLRRRLDGRQGNQTTVEDCCRIAEEALAGMEEALDALQVSPRMARTVAGRAEAGPVLRQDRAANSRPRGAQLSEREEEVLRLVAEGYTNKEISIKLSLSVKTVETYKARSMEKLDLPNRAAIVRYALHGGWLQPGK